VRNEREHRIEQLLAQKESTGRVVEGEIVPAAHGPGCPDFTDLVDLALDQADGERASRLKEHCQDCPECTTRLAAYRAAGQDDETPEPARAGSVLEMVARSQFRAKSRADQ